MSFRKGDRVRVKTTGYPYPEATGEVVSCEVSRDFVEVKIIMYRNFTYRTNELELMPAEEKQP